MAVSKNTLRNGVIVIGILTAAFILVDVSGQEKETAAVTQEPATNTPVTKDPKEVENLNEPFVEEEDTIGKIGSSQALGNFSITLKGATLEKGDRGKSNVRLQVEVLKAGEGDDTFSPQMQLILSSETGQTLVPESNPIFENNDYKFGISVGGYLDYKIGLPGTYKLKAIIPGEDREEDISWVFTVK